MKIRKIALQWGDKLIKVSSGEIIAQENQYEDYEVSIIEDDGEWLYLNHVRHGLVKIKRETNSYGT